ncbi:MAG: TonB-dependent receptor [Saprospiraceae bacterium]|nr:TonB-dependent receptor [Saprospiraceae bacterium]
MKRFSLLSLLTFLFVVSASVAFAQRTVSGMVTAATDQSPLIGATILVKGTDSGTISDVDGSYSLRVTGNDAVLVVSYTGYETQEIAVGAQNVINISMAESATALSEVVVTGYTSEKKADIIGSVSVVNTQDLLTNPSANLTSQLQGRAAGVVVSGGGEPGAAAKVRIRGFTSFGNSDPLYVIDGVPTGDASKINPQDIESVQVLKDATAASIYGARAAQGVVVITTKQGKSGTLKLSYDTYVGTQTLPSSTFPNLINTNQYLDYLQRSRPADFKHPVFGLMSNPSIPDRIVVSKDLKSGVSASDPAADPALYSLKDYGNTYQILGVSAGTNWFDEIVHNGLIQSHQVSASGGTEKATYSLGLNYLDQDGALIYTGYKRYAARMNTQFNPTKFLRIGENIQVIHEQFLNGDNRGEGGAWAQAYRMVPYIPVKDIAGGWGGNAVGESGNGTSPVAQLYRQKDNQRKNWKIFGNVYGELEPVKNLVLRTSFGIDQGNFYSKNYTYRTYERSENVGNIGLIQSNDNNLFWTWTNTATYSIEFGKSSLKFLAGTEAIKGQGSGISVNTNTFDFEDPEFITLNTDQNTAPVVSDNLFRQTLASTFGRVDYILNNKYLFNATVRRDGSSKFGADNRYGVFPAFGLGWRVSEESFMDGADFIDDLKLRGGWGRMGSERVVDANNQYTTFYSNQGVTNYDINRSQNTLTPGYTARRVGSTASKWETSETTNVGFDLSMANYKWDISFNWFNNDTKDLLVQRVRNGLEPLVQQPYINIGKMRNRGFDFSITNRGSITKDLKYDATLTFTHYKNEVIDIDGNPETFYDRNASRLNNVVRTQAGQPISYFRGFQIDGFFESQADIDALSQNGAVIGSWRYKDQNDDKVIDDNDRVYLGSPHPDFIAGLNLGLQYKGFDFNAFLVWNYGNEIYNYTKYFTDMRVFVGGVSERVLTDGWQAGKSNATLPRLAPGADNGYTSFTTSTSNSYYVEDGSYIRAKTVQLGYTIPVGVTKNLKMQNLRVYVQGQNLFTITKYSGPDPDINIQGDDLLMGVDQSGYPNPRQILFGLNVTF